MDPEDGLIWVYDPGDEETTACASFGIKNLKELIQIHPERETPFLQP